MALGDTYLPVEGTALGLARAIGPYIGVNMPEQAIVGRVTFVDVATGRRQSGFDGVQSRLARLTFSPDGRTLVADGNSPAVAGSASVTTGPDNIRTLVFWDVPVVPLK